MSSHKETIAAARRDGLATLNESACKGILADFGIAVPANAVAGNSDAVASAAGALKAPLVVKAISREVVHKSEFGAVRINLADAAAAVAAAKEIDGNLSERGVHAEAYLVEEMAPTGKELVVGGIVDPHFGPAVMVGLGGIFVEIFKDVSFRLCPIDAAEAAAMLDELRAAPILAGARGEAGVDRQKIIDVLLAVGGEGGLLETLRDDITELDINPLIASETAAVAADARIVIAPANAKAKTQIRPDMSDEEVRAYFEPLFAPRSIGVLGASTKGSSRANGFITQIQNFGFKGPIYPIHPNADEINGLKAYPSLGDTPEEVDYAYIAIPAASVSESIVASKGRVRFAQVLASGFGEIEGGQSLQDELVEKAHGIGARILGPNCIGAYSPRGHLTFTSGAPEEPGPVGIVSQSGGLAADMVRRGKERGLRFSGLVALGNCADIGPADLLEYYLADTNTRVVGMYLESLQEGRRFFDLLRRANAKKPVVILKGGRTSLGHKMAVSHTGALSSDNRIWDALSRQTGAVLVDDLDQFLDVLLGFQMYRPRNGKPTTKAALFGNGGGASVLAVDTFAERGVEIAPFRAPALAELQAMNLPVGASVSNPIDVPIGSLVKAEGSVCDNVLRIVQEYEGDDVGALVLHFNLPIFWSHVIKSNQDFIKNTLEAVKTAREAYDDPLHFLVVFRSDGRADIEEKKREYLQLALSYGIPVFNELSNAAVALSAISHHERFLSTS